jgi:hypothetical protein
VNLDRLGTAHHYSSRQVEQTTRDRHSIAAHGRNPITKAPAKRRKIQNPGTKSQTKFKLQVLKREKPSQRFLGFLPLPSWDFLGIWVLDLGISRLLAAT